MRFGWNVELGFASMCKSPLMLIVYDLTSKQSFSMQTVFFFHVRKNSVLFLLRVIVLFLF